MILVVGLGTVAVMSGTIFDLLDTSSVVDSLEITAPAIYSDQGYVTVQVKNNGNTAIEAIYAVLLVDNNAGANDANCKPGTQPLLVTTEPGATAAVMITLSTNLNPGESTTISGGLQDAATITATEITIDAGVDVECDGDPTGSTLEDRGEYILQISGTADDDIISKTVPVRTR